MNESHTPEDAARMHQVEEATGTVLPKFRQFIEGLSEDEQVALAILLRGPVDDDTVGHHHAEDYYGAATPGGWYLYRAWVDSWLGPWNDQKEMDTLRGSGAPKRLRGSRG